MNMQDFNSLPLSVREDIKHTLRAFEQVQVIFQYGECHVSTGVMLCAQYPDDFRVVGDVHRNDLYTPEEQTINYIETFHDYPFNYKGKRDYSMLRHMATCRKNGEECKVKLVDGTAQLVI